MSNPDKQIEAAVAATKILSPTMYTWFGRAIPPLAPHVLRSMTSRTARDYLLYNLQRQLYKDFYCQGYPAPAEYEDEDPAGIPMGMTPFLQVLSQANAGRGCYEEGWEVVAVEACAVLARKNGLNVWAWTTECVVPPGGLDTGAQIGLRLPNEFLNLLPGFYMALGDRELPPGDSDIVVRFYWHLTPDGAPHFVRSVTSLLNEASFPFRLKVLRDPSLFTRCDAGVVYTLKRDYQPVSRIMAEVYAEVSGALQDRIPAFAKPLAPGLGLAEDPGAGQSFGEHRCQLLADALISAYESGMASTSERMRAVAERFERDGLTLATPFLNPRSPDEYDFELVP
jgi:hypothetical protein